MNSSRLWTLGSVLVIVALIAGTWFVGISPQLAEAAKANSERANVETLNAKHAVTLASLKAQFEKLPELEADLEEVRVAVPASDESAELLRQLHSLADAAGVTITDLVVSSPERFVAPIEPPEDQELAAALGSVTPENFLFIPVEQTVAGEHADVMNYVDALQKGERTFLVHDLSSPGLPAADAQVEITFTGQIFVLLDGVSAAPVEGEQVPAEGAEIPK